MAVWRMGVVALVMAILAGCGVPGAAQPRRIRFGATISITGQTAKEGEAARDGYLLFVETVNARGGITVAGQRYLVDLRYYDDESRPERAAELYEKLVLEDQVDFLLGPYGSAPTDAAAAIAERHKIPLIAGNGTADTIFEQGRRYTFGVMAPASTYLYGVIDLALTAQPALKTVAILYADDTFARASAFQARFPEYASVPYNAACSAAVFLAYQKAIERAGTLDREQIRATLTSLSIQTFFGPIRFDARGVNSIRPMAIEQLQPDGKQYTVFPLDMAERPALFLPAP